MLCSITVYRVHFTAYVLRNIVGGKIAFSGFSVSFCHHYLSELFK